MLKTGAPHLSIVIPSVNGWGDLEGCLAALAIQVDHVDLEVIVADRVGDSVRGPLRNHYPEVRLLEAGPDVTIPDLRALAFEQARAEVVGVIEDHVIVPPDWAERMLEAHSAGAEVVGGAVDNAADQRWVDWAAFLCEYSHCLVPPTGPADWVTGNNVTYRRTLLQRFRDTVGQGRWENHLHDAMRDAGITLVSRPDIRVGHKKHYTAAEYLHQRYLYARSYAGMRLRGAGTWRKLGYGSAALALPPLLFTRIVSRVLRSGRHRRELMRSLPLLALFVTAWATGEVVGYWRGDGDSLQKVC
ncbi:MAG: glycosyltransferase [Geodermatophilaceae bacterium]|nr:glycosyltransferase [Geodermatophilaceae bacterium]